MTDTAAETMQRALMALRLEVPASIADDVKRQHDVAVAEAVADERKRCERIAKERSSRREVSPWSMGWRDCAETIAAAIRGGDDAGS